MSTEVMTAPWASSRSSKPPSRWTLYATWVVAWLGVGTVVAAFGEALGPNVTGPAIGCGSPFLGRYFASGGDPAATLAYMCLHAAPHHRFFTFLLGGIGLALLLGVVLFVYLKELPARGPNLLGTVGSIAAVVLIAGASVAVLRAPGSSGSSTTTSIPRLFQS
jgi:hypothetical protein